MILKSQRALFNFVNLWANSFSKYMSNIFSSFWNLCECYKKQLRPSLPLANAVVYVYVYVVVFFVHDMSKCRSSQNKDVQYNLFLKLFPNYFLTSLTKKFTWISLFQLVVPESGMLIHKYAFLLLSQIIFLFCNS